MFPCFTAIALFGSSHLAVLGTIVVVSAVAIIAARLSGREEIRRGIGAGLASGLIFNKLLVYCTAFGIEGVRWQAALPMHMCDWSAISAIIALLFRSQLAYELAFFWGLGGTLQATLTPDLRYDFPDIRFLTFFISHGGTLVAIAFLTLGMKMRPYPKSLLRILIWSNIYLLAAGTVDYLLDENYGYLRAKPVHGSLLDYLGPWPWYILSLEGIALLSFLVYYTPFFMMDLVRKRRSPGGGIA